jgi:tetratricopeptide (TPR) repeat protein
MPETRMSFEQAIQLGIQHQQAGRYSEAESIYRQILAVQPNHPDALHLLGGLALQFGKLDIAADLMRRAVAAAPRVALYRCNLGLVLNRAGKWDQAIDVLRSAVQIQPDFAEAYYNLGNALAGREQFAQAVEAYQRAVALRGDNPEWHNNLANALRYSGRTDDAEAAYRQAIALHPAYAEAHNNLASLLHAAGKIREAIEGYRRALALRADFAEAMNNLGNALLDIDESEGAIASYRQAIAINPSLLTARSHLGLALHGAGEYQQALRVLEETVSLKPDWNLARYQLSITRLLLGDFPRGWRDHEARRSAGEISVMCRRFDQPMWDGQSELRGRRLLLHEEQGFGDSIQFVRYLPALLDRGAEVILHCRTELVRLFAQSFPQAQVIDRSQALPEFDVHCPLMSLPFLMHPTLQTIHNPAPYLRADPAASEHWAGKLKAFEGKIKAGLCWAGRPTHKSDRQRSIAVDVLSVLADVPNVAWISLQKNGSCTFATNWTSDLHDFADTAALIQNLDLLVTVDTAVAHLAGALGKKVLLLLAYVPDWRWLLDREDSPWYPTIRLLRQPRRGDWTVPLRRIAQEFTKSPA